MDALLPAFLAAALAEFGDKTQLLAVLLAVRYHAAGQVLAGIALAALANSLISGIGGGLVAQVVNFRATTLLLALALLFAAAGAIRRQRDPELAVSARLGPLAASAVAFFILEFGDKTQFLTFAIAARSGAPLLAAAGATAGVLVAAAPAVLLGPALARTLPVGGIRLAAAVLFLLGGIVAALVALRLV